MPEPATIVAIVPSPLLQVPPVEASVNVMVELTHTALGTLIAAGSGLTVTTAVVVQVVELAVKVIIDVPGDTPVTEPEPVTTVATLVVPLLQVPPVVSVNKVVNPWHTLAVPVIAAGNALTTTVFDLKQPAGNV